MKTLPKTQDPPGKQPSSHTARISHVAAWVGRGWLAVAYFTSGLCWWFIPLALTTWLTMALTTLPVIVIGVPLALLLLALAPLWSRAERFRIKAFLGAQIAPETDSQPLTLRTLALSPTRWKSIGHSTFQTVWAPFAGGLVFTVVTCGALGVAVPTAAAVFGTRAAYIGDSATTAVVGCVVSAIMFIAAPGLALLLAQVDQKFGHWLLGVDETRRIKNLTGRVEGLTSARSAAVAAAEAERRRIERDLHDGPQQQLVSIAMDVSMARDVVDEDPELAKEILAGVKDSAKSSIAEMREVARGTIPPILTDRGLDAAVSALAARCPVPVTVSSNVSKRMPAHVESCAYFVVSESLTNVAKHSAATLASVDLDCSQENLTIVVEDNGDGGVDTTKGTGVVGLRQRLTGLDGILEISSPPGGPTRLTAGIPLVDREKQSEEN